MSRTGNHCNLNTEGTYEKLVETNQYVANASIVTERYRRSERSGFVGDETCEQRINLDETEVFIRFPKIYFISKEVFGVIIKSY